MSYLCLVVWLMKTYNAHPLSAHHCEIQLDRDVRHSRFTSNTFIHLAQTSQLRSPVPVRTLVSGGRTPQAVVGVPWVQVVQRRQRVEFASQRGTAPVVCHPLEAPDSRGSARLAAPP